MLKSNIQEVESSLSIARSDKCWMASECQKFQFGGANDRSRISDVPP